MKETNKEHHGAFASRPGLARLVAIKRLFARLVLVQEQLLPMLLPLASTAALFLSAAWFGIFRTLPPTARMALLIAFGVAALASLLPFRKLRWPSVANADRLLEERNGLPHQPVKVQEDAPAFDTAFSRALWREHQARMAEKIASLDAGMPRPDIASHDRFALRAWPALILAVAFSFSLSNRAGSISDAFLMPVTESTNPDLRIDAWITPPSYTVQAPTYLTSNVAAADGPTAVPQFSELTVRLTGGQGDERVAFQPDGSDKSISIEEQDAASTEGKGDANARSNPATSAAAPAGPPAGHNHVMKLETSGTLSVNGQRWPLNVMTDKPPEIAFDGLPRTTVNGALEIGFKAKDDYGVQEAHAEIVPVDADPSATPLYALPDYKLDINSRNRRDFKGLGSHDLTEDPLAGKRVRITLVAKDGAGQTGRSPPFEMTMPARNFTVPLAGAVAEQRQVFALDTRKMPEAIALNEALTIRADETIPNLTHYLLLQSALTRMKLASGDAALKDTADYLWQIALGMEDGQLSEAEKKLRDAQKKLSDALQRNAPDSEIKKLTDELRQAMNSYLKELAQRQQGAPSQPNQKSANVLRQQDIDRMMDQIENLARSGNRDAAQQMLSELQRMMNNLQAGRPQQGQQQGREDSPERQQMDKLGQILRDQQKLMEQTFRLDQALKNKTPSDELNSDNEDGDANPLNQPMPGQQGQQQPRQPMPGQQQDPKMGQNQPGNTPEDSMTEEQLRDALKQLQKQQSELEKQLGQLQKNLGDLGMKPTPGFGQAQREMNGAAGALGQGQGDPAVQGQGRALEALRQGARDMLTQMMQAGQGQGQGMQGQGSQGNSGRDPLGRSRADGRFDSQDGPKVPDEIDVQRARQILDAIRQRLGDNPSQEEERRYLERLLDIQ